MSYLLDTNVVSELRRKRPHGAVIVWMTNARETSLTISAVTIGELQTGIEKLRGRNDERAGELDAWVDTILQAFDVVPADADVFRCWAKLMRNRSPVGWRDAMIAATAIVHGLTVVTRNTKDFLDFGVPLLDLFVPP